MQKVKLKTTFKDKRGIIIDLIENETINAITSITFTKNATRGNHFHKKTHQWNYVVSGKIKYFFMKKGAKRVSSIILDKGSFLLTPPLEHHALTALEKSEILVFAKGPRAAKEYETDTFYLETPLNKK